MDSHPLENFFSTTDRFTVYCWAPHEDIEELHRDVVACGVEEQHMEPTVKFTAHIAKIPDDTSRGALAISALVVPI
jgi:hypothetical protein